MCLSLYEFSFCPHLTTDKVNNDESLLSMNVKCERTHWHCIQHTEHIKNDSESIFADLIKVS